MDQKLIKSHLRMIADSLLVIITQQLDDEQAVNEIEKQQSPSYWTKKILTINEVALYTGYSKNYIKKLTHLNEIPFSKPNGKSLFDRVEIEKWLMSGRIKTKVEIERDAALYFRNKPSDNRKQR